MPENTEPTKDLEKFEERQKPASMPVPEQQSFFATIERLSMRPDVDVSKIKQIMEIQEHILDRNAEQAFNAAMTKAQSRIELVVAKSKNDQTHSTYADLKTVLLSAKPVYTAEGFSLMFYEGETTVDNHKRVCVDIMHEMGHTKQRYGDFAIQTTGIAGKSMMTQIHGEGSAFMYGRRYLTCMIFNIPTGDDDDGNAAGSPSLFELWDINCDEVGTAAKSVDDIAKWWATNSAKIKKELSKADAAKIYAKVTAHSKRLKVPEREPGQEGVG